MPGFGQAIPDDSKTSANQHRALSIFIANRRRTKMCVLEREGDDILHPFERGFAILFGETLRNDDFNASYILSGTPPILGEQLLVEWRESQTIMISVLVELLWQCCVSRRSRRTYLASSRTR